MKRLEVVETDRLAEAEEYLVEANNEIVHEAGKREQDGDADGGKRLRDLSVTVHQVIKQVRKEQR